MNIIKKWVCFILFVYSISLFASIPSWEIVPAESKLTFTGTQNNSPIRGEFKKFAGQISFDPKKLDESKVRIVVDINSVQTTYKDFTETLLTEDWFSARLFPQAVFESKKISKTGENTYQANGLLTIRDHTMTVNIPFKAQILSDHEVIVTGETTLKRLLFGVGRGDWGSTDEVKDEVLVRFTIKAVRQIAE